MTKKPRVYSTYKKPEFKRTPKIQNAVWKKTGGRCTYCNCDLLPAGREKNSFTIDHVYPVRFGGTDDIDNLVPACFSCNSKKGVSR